ncbi:MULTISPECIES: zinc ABC transporter substrate-binding protein [unclassified Haematospirillum]|uniref:zinc ABC transporter substrate-binding protein n=1 Tax=unclassified Haematospirillum TaxID=2622088 RepID=UPI0014388170|nr:MULTISPECIES: zinc ABC transporter substrate-binding protein [unclassified Haematospirillum]NKD55763.1 zinc ABC transporter solute-binding protein [Haematospirillum sp. H4890]NKD75802.1 zinc ABC transporter solute-binding protein [Haematospirillum sp. H4485]
MFASLRLTIAASLALVAIPGNPVHASVPVVVASITPVHALVSGVMAGVGTPVLLVPPGQSPHTYTLRPSDARVLASAQTVFWIGDALETFLPGTLKSLSRAKAVSLLEAPGIIRLPVRSGGLWEHAEHTHHHHAERGQHSHHHQGADPHIWLDPRNAVAMVNAIAHTLSEQDPDNAHTYRTNAANLQTRLRTLEEHMDHTLEPARHLPFLIFHDSIQYIENRFGLHAVGAITIDPSLPPGARHLNHIRETARHHRVSCLFAEPSSPRRTVTQIARETGTRTSELDPLGGGDPRETGYESYTQLMNDITASLASCLTGGNIQHRH